MPDGWIGSIVAGFPGKLGARSHAVGRAACAMMADVLKTRGDDACSLASAGLVLIGC